MYPYAHQLLVHAEAIDESRLRFELDNDSGRWPWLPLPAWHPARVGKLSFFTGFKGGEMLLNMPADTATAVTALKWHNHPTCLGNEPPAGGTLKCELIENRFHYDSELFTADGEPQQIILAQGVAFKRRNFSDWRGRMKQALNAMRPVDFGFSDPASVGVKTAAECFVSPLHENKQGLACYALLDRKSGFVPTHPWHGGTNDHVNASHQLDVVWQAAHLIGRAQGWWSSARPMLCVRGEARFRHYIELGAPIEIRLKGWKPLSQGRQLSFALSQGSHACSVISLDLTLASQG